MCFPKGGAAISGNNSSPPPPQDPNTQELDVTARSTSTGCSSSGNNSSGNGDNPAQTPWHPPARIL